MGFVLLWLESLSAVLLLTAAGVAVAAAPARLPDHENAAPLYEAAAELLRESPDDPARLDAWLTADRLNPDDPERRAYLERRAAGLELIAQATARPGCRFDFSPD